MKIVIFFLMVLLAWLGLSAFFGWLWSLRKEAQRDADFGEGWDW